MCMEPECLVPLVEFQSANQVVLIGDHKQLQPIVFNTEAKKLGLEKSMFERYKNRALMLDEQYRMVFVTIFATILILLPFSIRILFSSRVSMLRQFHVVSAPLDGFVQGRRYNMELRQQYMVKTEGY